MQSILEKYMTRNKEGHPTDRLNVMVIDEDKGHAYSTSLMLSQFNFCVAVYTSPIKALDYLENHAQDFDLVLADVHMEELHGFALITVAKEIHKSIKVIMMSTQTTMYTMKRCVELGARFLVKKPLDVGTIQNIWQHLDLKVLRMEKIKGLLQDDSPKNTKMIKNAGTVDRNQIATRVQEHKLDLEKEVSNALFTNKSRKGASSSRAYAKTHHICLNTPQSHPWSQPAKSIMQVLPGDTELGDVYAAMQRSLQLGTIFDESDYSSDPCGDEDRSGEDEIGGYSCANYATATHSSCDQVAVAVSCNADASQEVMSKTTADHQATRVSEPADLSADEANATYSTGSLQVHVVLARNVDASQESIKSTDDDQNVPKGSGAATLKLVNYSDTESE